MDRGQARHDGLLLTQGATDQQLFWVWLLQDHTRTFQIYWSKQASKSMRWLSLRHYCWQNECCALAWQPGGEK